MQAEHIKPYLQMLMLIVGFGVITPGNCVAGHRMRGVAGSEASDYSLL